jgi:cytochrome c peroxidase
MLALALASMSHVGAASAGGPDRVTEAGYVWQLPPGFPEPAVPADNPMSAAKVALGRRLFFETGLSVNGSTSCARCHDPTRAFTDGRAHARGALGDTLPRGTMSLANVAWNASYGWNDRAVRSLEMQMRRPLFNTHPVEMGLAGREAEVIAFLSADAAYRESFERAFPGDPAPIRLDNLIRAIASFERTLVSGGSPFDHYVYRGEHEALDAGEKRGLALFYSRRLGCANCHGGFNFSGTWTERDRPHARPAFARDAVHGPLLRVPTLRNVALTAPYMHDGRYATLEEVISHYEREGRREAASAGVRSRPSLQTFELSAAERRDLIAFLGALTDRAFVNPQ